MVENYGKAAQAIPILDQYGDPTGIYTFQGHVANKALELIGKELGMFREKDRTEIAPILKEINIVYVSPSGDNALDINKEEEIIKADRQIETGKAAAPDASN